MISLGPKDLIISDLSLMLMYPSGGPIQGSFAGTIALDTVATLSIAYDVPGPLIIRANLPKIGLTDLAREIASVTDLPFPPGFPEIDLLDSFVQFTRDTTGGAAATYDFILRTTVAIGSTTNFNLMALVLTDESTMLIAHLGSNYSKGAFTFNGFDPAWESTGTSNASVSATARGTVDVDGNKLSLAVTGAVTTDGTARLALAVVDWVHPFGYQRLIVRQFAIAVALADASPSRLPARSTSRQSGANRSCSQWPAPSPISKPLRRWP